MNQVEIKYKHFANRTQLSATTALPVDDIYSTTVIDESGYNKLFFEQRMYQQPSVSEEITFPYNGETRTAYKRTWDVYAIEFLANENLVDLVKDIELSGDVTITYTEDNTSHIADKKRAEYFVFNASKIPAQSDYFCTIQYRVRSNETDYTNTAQTADLFNHVITNSDLNGEFLDFYDFETRTGAEFLKFQSIFKPIELYETTRNTQVINELEFTDKALTLDQFTCNLFLSDANSYLFRKYFEAANSNYYEDLTDSTTVVEDIEVVGTEIIATNPVFADFRIGQTIEIDGGRYTVESIMSDTIIYTVETVGGFETDEFKTFQIYGQAQSVAPSINQLAKNLNQIEYILTYDYNVKYNDQ